MQNQLKEETDKLFEEKITYEHFSMIKGFLLKEYYGRVPEHFMEDYSKRNMIKVLEGIKDHHDLLKLVKEHEYDVYSNIFSGKNITHENCVANDVKKLLKIHLKA